MPSYLQANLESRFCTNDAEAKNLARRVSVQIEFAKTFAEALGREGWLTLIGHTEKILLDTIAGGDQDALTEAVTEVENLLGEVGTEAKKYTIHCVGHGHIDMNWMWSWPETVAATHDTFASVLSLMRQYPELTYSQSQGAVYALVEKYYPQMFEEIRERVREGRWEITAAHWVEGDKNVSSGESLCRHLLLTRAYLQEKFGIAPEDQSIDWEPDTFGHAATVPSIVSQGAVKRYYCCRPGGGFAHQMIGDIRPSLFYWEAPDGSRVLVNKESTWYNSYEKIGDNVALPLVAFAKETGLHTWLNVFGIGNHGGGPTRKEIDYLLEVREWPIYPKLEFSTASKYFDAIENEIEAGTIKQLPVIAHELNFEFTGCYTTQTLIKQANRFGETFLIESETIGAIANRTIGLAYPHEMMRDAWLKVLFNQFHDILPGSGVRQTREHAMAEFQEVGAITGAIKRQALDGLAARIDTASLVKGWDAEPDRLGRPGNFEAGAGLGATVSGISATGLTGTKFRPFVVFNQCAWHRSERVRVSLYDSGFAHDQIVVLSDDGILRPVLISGAEPNTWGHSVIYVEFDARDLPPLGYRTFILCEQGSVPNMPFEESKSVEVLRQYKVVTPDLSFRIDREQGGITELVDLRSGARLSPTGRNIPMGAFQYIVERPQNMSAWVLGREVEPPVTLRASQFNMKDVAQEPTGSQFGIAPCGVQVDQYLSVPGTQSHVKLQTTVHELASRIYFTAEIDWREIGNSSTGIPGLLITVPLALRNISCRYEVPFGCVERDFHDGEEVPALRYAHISGTAITEDGREVFAGVTLLQDCKHGHSIVGSDDDGYQLRLRVVRSSYDPDPTPEIAVTKLRYAIVLHDRPVTPAELARLGDSWCQPPIALPAGCHGGEAEPKGSFGRVVSPNIAMTSLKLSNDNSGLILRLVELNGLSGEVSVELSPELLAGATRATVLDVLERPDGGRARLENGLLAVDVGAYSFVTVRVD